MAARQGTALPCLQEPQRVCPAILLHRIRVPTPTAVTSARIYIWISHSESELDQPVERREALSQRSWIRMDAVSLHMFQQVPPCVVVMCHTQPMPKRGEAVRQQSSVWLPTLSSRMLSTLAGVARGQDAVCLAVCIWILGTA